MRRPRGVILEGEEIKSGYIRWRRPPAREASVPAPQGPRRRAAEQLELLVIIIKMIRMFSNSLQHLLFGQQGSEEELNNF